MPPKHQTIEISSDPSTSSGTSTDNPRNNPHDSEADDADLQIVLDNDLRSPSHSQQHDDPSDDEQDDLPDTLQLLDHGGIPRVLDEDVWHDPAKSPEWVFSSVKGANLRRYEAIKRELEQRADPIWRAPRTDDKPVNSIEDILPQIRWDHEGVLAFRRSGIAVPRPEGVEKVSEPTEQRDQFVLRISTPRYTPFQQNQFQLGMKRQIKIGVELLLAPGLAKESDDNLLVFLAQVMNFVNRMPVNPWELPKNQFRRIVEHVGMKFLPHRGDIWKRKCFIRPENKKTRKTDTETTTNVLLIYFLVPNPAVYGMRPPLSGDKGKKGENDFKGRINPKYVRLDLEIPEPLSTVDLEVGSEEELLTKTGTVHGCTVEQQQQALRLAKHIASNLALTYGTNDQMIQLLIELREPYMIQDPRRTHSVREKRLPYGGQSLFLDTPSGELSVSASLEVAADVGKLPTITMFSLLLKRRVMGVIFEGFMTHARIEEAWQAGCALADYVANYGVEVLDRSCQCGPNVTHACDGCLRLTPCPDLHRYGHTYLMLCGRCAKKADRGTVLRLGWLESDPLLEKIAKLEDDELQRLLDATGSFVSNGVALCNKEIRTLKLGQVEATKDREEARKALMRIRGETIFEEDDVPVVEFNDDFSVGPSRRPLFHTGGPQPLTMSVACIYPVIMHTRGGKKQDKQPVARLRGHVGPNFTPMPLYLNFLQWIHPLIMIIIAFHFDRLELQGEATEPSRDELLMRLAHLHLVQKQIPYFNKDRFSKKMTEEQWGVLLRQMETGIADRATCEQTVYNPWRIKGSLIHQDDFNSIEEEELPELESVQECINQLMVDPEVEPEYLPEVNGVPYPFEVGPRPTNWSWKMFYQIIACRLDVMTAQCNRRYITTVTVPVLIVIICVQIVRRKLPNCPDNWRVLFNLPIGPYSQSSVSLSFGHIRHHENMISGLAADKDEKFEGLEDFDFDALNIRAEPWGANAAQSDWDEHRDLIREHFRELPIGQSKSLPRDLEPLPADWNPLEFMGSTVSRPPAEETADNTTDQSSNVLASADDCLLAIEEAGERSSERTMEDIRADIIAEIKRRRIERASAAQQPKASATPSKAAGKVRQVAKKVVDKAGQAVGRVAPLNTRATRRNLTNIGGTCYSAAGVQALVALNAFRTIVADPEKFVCTRTIDPPERLQALRKALHEINVGIFSSGPKLQESYTRNLLVAMNALHEEWELPKPGEMADPGRDYKDASEFMFAVIRYIVQGADAGDPSIKLGQLLRRQEELLAEQARSDEGLPNVKETVMAFADAHRREECDSPLFPELYLGFVRETRCQDQDCQLITRSVLFQDHLVLAVPMGGDEYVNDLSLTFSLEEMVAQAIEPTIGDIGIECFDDPNKTHGRSKDSYQRLAKLPRTLMLRFSRWYWDYRRDPTRPTMIRNPIITPEVLELGQHTRRQLPSDPIDPTVTYIEQPTTYSLVEFVVYHSRARHYVTYTRSGLDLTGPWMRFDDTANDVQQMGDDGVFINSLWEKGELITTWVYQPSPAARQGTASPEPIKLSSEGTVKRADLVRPATSQATGSPWKKTKPSTKPPPALALAEKRADKKIPLGKQPPKEQPRYLLNTITSKAKALSPFHRRHRNGSPEPSDRESSTSHRSGDEFRPREDSEAATPKPRMQKLASPKKPRPRLDSQAEVIDLLREGIAQASKDSERQAGLTEELTRQLVGAITKLDGNISQVVGAITKLDGKVSQQIQHTSQLLERISSHGMSAPTADGGSMALRGTPAGQQAGAVSAPDLTTNLARQMRQLQQTVRRDTRNLSREIRRSEQTISEHLNRQDEVNDGQSQTLDDLRSLTEGYAMEESRLRYPRSDDDDDEMRDP